MLKKSLDSRFLHWMKTFLRCKLGLATTDVFNIVVSYTERFKDQINYTLLAGELNQ